jgi:outer membrane lipoprotein-sorting protein
VTELGDLLELLHGARNRFRTVRLVLRSSNPGAKASELFRISLEQGRKVREDWEGVYGDQRRTGIAVRDGSRWWSWSPDTGVVSTDTHPDAVSNAGKRADHLLDPALMLAVADFEVLGHSRAAGRDALRVRAMPRDVPDWVEGTLVRVADKHELTIDAERGVVLRIESRAGGELRLLEEVTEIAFDDEFSPDTFVFAPPA